MAESGSSGQAASWPRGKLILWTLIFAPVVVLVLAGVVYHNPAHINVNLACFSGALLYAGVLFLFKADMIIDRLQPDQGHSPAATRWLGGFFVAVSAWQLYNALMH